MIPAIAAVIFTVFWMGIIHGPRIKIGRFKPFSRKPFNCEYCLPIYLFALFSFLPIYIAEVIMYGCAASITSALIFKIFPKWFN